MKRILIIEDERLSADRLRRMLCDIDDTIEISGPLTTMQEVIDELRTGNHYDLIFSDIRLKDRLVFEAFHEVMPSSLVIFTTAYDEYALEAFRHNGIGYLLKPFLATELMEVMSRLNPASGTTGALGSSLNAAAREMKCFRERILVSRGDELIPLRVSDIGYIRKTEEHVVAVTRSGDQYRLPLTMQDLEEMGIEQLSLKKNDITILSNKNQRGWEIRLESEKLYYFTIHILEEDKKAPLNRVVLDDEVIRKYFPKTYTTKQMEDTIINLLDQWQKKRERDQER